MIKIEPVIAFWNYMGWLHHMGLRETSEIVFRFYVARRSEDK